MGILVKQGSCFTKDDGWTRTVKEEVEVAQLHHKNKMIHGMRTVSDNEHTVASIIVELDRLYASASYLNADGRELDLVVNLIGAAIVELESVVAEAPRRNLRLVVGAQ